MLLSFCYAMSSCKLKIGSPHNFSGSNQAKWKEMFLGELDAISQPSKLSVSPHVPL